MYVSQQGCESDQDVGKFDNVLISIIAQFIKFRSSGRFLPHPSHQPNHIAIVQKQANSCVEESFLIPPTSHVRNSPDGNATKANRNSGDCQEKDVLLISSLPSACIKTQIMTAKRISVATRI